MISMNSLEMTCSQLNIDLKRRFRRQLNREQINLESHQLVWLDPAFIKTDITLERLRQIIDYTNVFDDIEDCLQYIEQIKNGNKIFLVCTKELNNELKSSLRSDKHNIYKTYIYAKDEKPEKLSTNLQVVKKDDFY